MHDSNMLFWMKEDLERAKVSLECGDIDEVSACLEAALSYIPDMVDVFQRLEKMSMQVRNIVCDL